MENSRRALILLCTAAQIFATATDECYFGFCNTTQNYPYEKIQVLLRDNNQYIHFFDTSPGRVAYVRKRKEITNGNCTVRSIGLYPKLGRNVEGDVSIIVNTEGFQQYVRYDQCLEPHCKPKLKTINLAVFDNSSENIYVDKFPIPVRCYAEDDFTKR